jgi:hypothetical protein
MTNLIDTDGLVDSALYLVDGARLCRYNSGTETFETIDADSAQLEQELTFPAVGVLSAEPVWKVKDSFMEALTQRFARIGKRATKLSVDAPSFRIIKTVEEAEVKYREQLETAEKTGRIIKWNYVTLMGTAPMLAGYTFVGTLEHAGEIGTVVRSVPGQAIPASYFEAVPGNCDHCHQIRSRAETFVVRHESGEHKQVGRQCIQDFLGGHDPKRALALIEMLSLASDILDAASGDDEEFFGGSVRGKEAFDTEFVLATTSAVIRNFGWVSRTMVREGKCPDGAQPTSSYVLAFLTDRNDKMFKDKSGYVDLEEKAKYTATDDDATRATAALEWARDLPESELLKSDYLHNIHILAKAGAIESKHFGLACSIMSAYNRELDRQAGIKARAETEVKTDCPEGRIVITGEVVGMKEQFTDFGACLKITVKDDRGFAVWLTCPSSIEHGLERGARVTMTATVTRSDRDASFGFGKRPTKAKVLGVVV